MGVLVWARMGWTRYTLSQSGLRDFCRGEREQGQAIPPPLPSRLPSPPLPSPHNEVEYQPFCECLYGGAVVDGVLQCNDPLVGLLQRLGLKLVDVASRVEVHCVEPTLLELRLRKGIYRA